MRSKSFFILFVTAASVHAMADKSIGGFAAHIGFGSLYGGGGACMEYQVLVSPHWRLTPFASAGLATPIYGGDKIYRFGYSVGVNAEIGHDNRIFLGPSFGSQYLDYELDGMNQSTNVNTVIGPAFVLGYKKTARFGLLWLAYGGLCYLVNDRHTGHKGFAPAFGLGVGYQF